jgi:hypothetical protein
MKRFALAALAVVVAFVLGRLTTAAQEPTHTERVIERQPIEQRVVHASSASSSLTADDVRAIVNEAIATRPAIAAAEPETPVDPAALAHAQEIVETGTADGRWTVDDRERLRDVVHRLDREQTRDVMTSLFDEINAGRVQLETDGPPT